jgi:hypothetical protein
MITAPGAPIVEDVLPGFEASAVNAIGAPKNTSTEIVERLNKESNAGLSLRNAYITLFRHQPWNAAALAPRSRFVRFTNATVRCARVATASTSMRSGDGTGSVRSARRTHGTTGCLIGGLN